MISGCATGKSADANLAPSPVVVDLTAARCIKADDRARHEATLTVQAPNPDVTTPDGRPFVSRGALKVKADEMRAAINRKNATIKRLIRAGDECVDGVGSSTPRTS